MNIAKLTLVSQLVLATQRLQAKLMITCNSCIGLVCLLILQLSSSYFPAIIVSLSIFVHLSHLLTGMICI